MTTKICKKCNIEHKLDNFTKNKRNKKDGLDNICKDCLKLKYNETREQNLEAQKKWREKNKDYQKNWRENRYRQAV